MFQKLRFPMDLNREWYRSEFVSHEQLNKHRPLEDELSFYDAVCDGNIEAVEANLNSHDFSNPEGMGKLSDNKTQNLRYHFVVTAALITRYCVHAGMEQDKAYSLSDFYINKMDKCKNTTEIAEVHGIMCMDFCKRMNEIKKSTVLSKHVVLCIDYIYSHIHYRITIEDLATHLNISKNYLSSIFKKEMGITISEYIRNIKLEKACNLLRYSDYSLSEIATYLDFSSESHFISVFSKSLGTTPSVYRKNNFRANEIS